MRTTTAKFLVIGLPPSFTSEQLRQLLAAESGHLQTAEMLPDTIATGVGYVQMADSDAGKRAAGRFLSRSMEDRLGVRPLVCQDHTGAFNAISKRWAAERTHAL